jgi:dethiobiotin synthetase
MLNIYISSPNKSDGKTFLSAGISATMQSLGYSTTVYKPIQTSGIDINGFMQSPDLTFIKSIDPYINTHFSYLFKENSEPLIASEAENSFIDIDFIASEYSKIIATSDCTILDSEGGLLSPLAPNTQNIDLIKKLQIPVLFVITPSENAINSTLLSIYTAIELGAEIRGVIINNIKENCPQEVLTSTTRIIEEYSGAKILGLIPNLGEKVLPEDLIMGILNGIDIESVFNVKIEKLGIN